MFEKDVNLLLSGAEFSAFSTAFGRELSERKSMSRKLNSDDCGYQSATGKISVTLKNDMLFHSVMQHSKVALKGLVCALKGLKSEDVKEVELTNPIDYANYEGKEIILDVKVILNNNEIMDIELQLYVGEEWERRSLLYLCRSFDCLGTGEDYMLLKPTTFVAIMNDPLFPDYPEFYSKYRLLNIANHQPYSSLLSVNVLYLNKTELASREDQDNGLVYWAKMFNATTWEEIVALANQGLEFEEVAKVMYNSNIIDQERTIMEAHQKFIMDKKAMYRNGYNCAKEEDKAEIEAQKAVIEAQKAEIDSLKELLVKAGITP